MNERQKEALGAGVVLALFALMFVLYVTETRVFEHEAQ